MPLRFHRGAVEPGETPAPGTVFLMNAPGFCQLQELDTRTNRRASRAQSSPGWHRLAWERPFTSGNGPAQYRAKLRSQGQH